MNFIQTEGGFFHGSAKEHGTDGLLMSGRCEQVVALFGDELQTDTLEFVANSDALTGKGLKLLAASGGRLLRTSDGKYLAIGSAVTDYTKLEPGTIMDLYNEEGGTVIGRFYLLTVRQVSRKSLAFTCTDGVGMLARMTAHNGGIYTGQTAGTVIDEIFDGSGLDYEIGQDVREVALFGHLPRASRRENLAKILVATGASMTEADGTLRISYLGKDQPERAEDARIYLDTGEVEYKHPATVVQATEHAFYALESDETVVLFDNTGEPYEADRQLVVFDEPCHDLAWNGGALPEEIEAGVNYAVVTGTGVLQGKQYTHTRRVVERLTGAQTAENVRRIEDNGLIGTHNSEYLLERMARYYGLEEGLSFDYYDRAGTMQPGTALDYVGPFGESGSGWLERKAFDLGSKTRARLEIAADWQPGPFGSNVTAYKLITASRSWIVPEGVTKVALVLGSGGDGGQAGFDGTDGGDGEDVGTPFWDGPGVGGEGGSPGSPGKIHTVTLMVSPGDELQISVGSPGSPGASNGAGGSPGSATTVTHNGTVYSSEDGQILPLGFLNQQTGDVYGLPGRPGFKGGDGGVINENDWSDGENVEADGQTWQGGLDGKTESHRYSTAPKRIYAIGGGGSGAVYGHDGANGKDGVIHSHNDVDGGDGGNAPAPKRLPDVPALAGGGPGGNGGGGGGAGGGVERDGTMSRDSWECGRGGSGSAGTQGTPGGKGFALLLYNGTDEEAQGIKIAATGGLKLGTKNGLKNWDGVLEYSTDGRSWTTWSGAEVIEAPEGVLYVRGIGNTVVTGSASDYNRGWYMQTAGEIRITGQAAALLDYQTIMDGQDPQMGDYAFANLFSGQGPLKEGPELPAANLSIMCFWRMFAGCSTLEVLPAIKAQTLPASCCRRMLDGCTKIRVATEQDSTYQTPWRIPQSGAATATSAALEGMLHGTGGTFTGTPEVEITYYTANAVK